ncbi:transposase [Flavobacterium sp. XS2P39]|uniref:transposase n=1 Tax=Flavobacterium sp. XS2P39 TaxID=3401725 RepID=UPI003AABD131
MKTTKDLRDSTVDICEQHLAAIRWNGTPECPYCYGECKYLKGKDKSYKCYDLKKIQR